MSEKRNILSKTLKKSSFILQKTSKLSKIKRKNVLCKWDNWDKCKLKSILHFEGFKRVHNNYCYGKDQNMVNASGHVLFKCHTRPFFYFQKISLVLIRREVRSNHDEKTLINYLICWKISMRKTPFSGFFWREKGPLCKNFINVFLFWKVLAVFLLIFFWVFLFELCLSYFCCFILSIHSIWDRFFFDYFAVKEVL